LTRICTFFTQNRLFFVHLRIKMQKMTTIETVYRSYCDSPLGELEITANENAITAVLFVGSWKQKEYQPERKPESPEKSELISQCIKELREYFDGKRQTFEVPFEHNGTAFQLKVWEKLFEIPFGQTISYQELSRRIGNEKAIRAVGTTNGSNKIGIIVPCHRVIGKNGTLVGYGGDLWRKKWLLEHEQNVLGTNLTLF